MAQVTTGGSVQGNFPAWQPLAGCHCAPREPPGSLWRRQLLPGAGHRSEPAHTCLSRSPRTHLARILKTSQDASSDTSPGLRPAILTGMPTSAWTLPSQVPLQPGVDVAPGGCPPCATPGSPSPLSFHPDTRCPCSDQTQAFWFWVQGQPPLSTMARAFQPLPGGALVLSQVPQQPSQSGQHCHRCPEPSPHTAWELQLLQRPSTHGCHRFHLLNNIKRHSPSFICQQTEVSG